MNAIFIIAYNTFWETIRNKILYNILLFACIIIALSISFGEWSVFARVQVMEDFGLAIMSLSALLLAVFIGVAMLGKEVSSKTVYMMATKPISRTSILLGKYTGLCFTLTINYLLLTVFFFITLLVIGGEVHFILLYAVFLSICEMFVIVAIALFFSTVTTPTLSAMFTIGLYIIGHFNDLVNVENSGEIHYNVLKIFYYLLPNLEHFNVRTPVVYGLPISGEYVLFAGFYAVLYSSLLLFLASIIFSKKDL